MDTSTFDCFVRLYILYVVISQLEACIATVTAEEVCGDSDRSLIVYRK
jgi:hypothetical protein